MWSEPFFFSPAWHKIGDSGRNSYWFQGELARYGLDDVRKHAAFEPLRRCIFEFRRIITRFDREGAPTDPSFDRPMLDLAYVVRCEQLRKVAPTPWQFISHSPKRGLYDPTNSVIYLNDEGFRDWRVLFEEVAHAHVRRVRSGEMDHYSCHLDIFNAFRATPLFALADAATQERLDNKWLPFLSRSCCRWGEFRLDGPDCCSCDDNFE